MSDPGVPGPVERNPGEMSSRVPGDQRFMVEREQLPNAAAAVVDELDARLALMVGEDDRADSGTYRLSYVFAPRAGGWVTLETAVYPIDPSFPSVTPLVPAAHWYEREVRDMFGLEPVGHPDPRRLVLHDDWPEDVHPLRKDFDPSIPVPRETIHRHEFHRLHGEGFVEIPVGPIHAGVIEPGHFRFAAVGEAVFHLETRLFYTHRGIEKLAEGKTPQQVVQIAERICGACSLSHGVAYTQAIETIAGVDIPERAAALRTIYLELERLYNHIGDLGNICAGVGFAVGAAYGARLKEDLQRLNERLIGNRFLHGVSRIGGVRQDLTDARALDLRATLDQIAIEFQRFVALLLDSDTLVERLTGTGILTTATARAFGAVGVAARASGIDVDSRRDHPHAYYDRLPQGHVPVVVRQEGDVMARALVRVDETLASLAIVRGVVDTLPGGPAFIPVGEIPGGRVAFALVESPRGENIHWVRTAADGTIDRYRVRSASYPNWPAVAVSAPGNMVPDFPLINKSFELCYACLDR